MVNTRKQGSRTRKQELQETVRLLNFLLGRTDQSLQSIASKHRGSSLLPGEDQQLAAQRRKLLDLRGKVVRKLAVARKKLQLVNKTKSSVKIKHNKHKVIKTKKAAPLKRNLLTDAIHDLDQELLHLRSARSQLQKKLNLVSGELGSTQSEEIDLRNKISELMRKEAVLSKKKTEAKDKIVSFDQRIEKIKSIERDLQKL